MPGSNGLRPGSRNLPGTTRSWPGPRTPRAASSRWSQTGTSWVTQSTGCSPSASTPSSAAHAGLGGLRSAHRGDWGARLIGRGSGVVGCPEIQGRVRSGARSSNAPRDLRLDIRGQLRDHPHRCWSLIHGTAVRVRSGRTSVAPHRKPACARGPCQTSETVSRPNLAR